MPNLQPQILALIFVTYLWTVLWKGLALWRAATLKQRNWFAGLLILSLLNLLGVPEIIFLFFFAKKKLTFTEIKSWISR
jgi:hypothetical protein